MRIRIINCSITLKVEQGQPSTSFFAIKDVSMSCMQKYFGFVIICIDRFHLFVAKVIQEIFFSLKKIWEIRFNSRSRSHLLSICSRFLKLWILLKIQKLMPTYKTLQKYNQRIENTWLISKDRKTKEKTLKKERS